MGTTGRVEAVNREVINSLCSKLGTAVGRAEEAGRRCEQVRHALHRLFMAVQTGNGVEDAMSNSLAVLDATAC
jgi:hypothetical protein